MGPRLTGFRLRLWDMPALVIKNKTGDSNIGALIITYTILGVPDYNYSIQGPNTLS